jgi:hypothetical protein
MKTFCLTRMIVVFLLIYSNGIWAQTTQTKLDHVELIKQFLGTWKTDINKDTITTIECKSYGNGQDNYIKTETNGKITWDARSLVGYDKKKDVLIEVQIMKDSPDVYLYARWFTSAKTLQEILLEDISNPEKAIYKWTFELTSPDLFVLTKTENNKTTGTYTFHREK